MEMCLIVFEGVIQGGTEAMEILMSSETVRKLGSQLTGLIR